MPLSLSMPRAKRSNQVLQRVPRSAANASDRPKSNVQHFALELRDQPDGDQSVRQREDERASVVEPLGAEVYDRRGE